MLGHTDDFFCQLPLLECRPDTKAAWLSWQQYPCIATVDILCHRIHFSSICSCCNAGLAKHSGCTTILTTIFLYCHNGQRRLWQIWLNPSLTSTPSLAGPMSHSCMAPRCASSSFVVSNGAYCSLVIQISVTTPSKFHQPSHRPRRDASLFVHTFQLRERESYSTLLSMWHS